MKNENSERSSSFPILFLCLVFSLLFLGVAAAGGRASEAPAGFDNLTNGFVSQSAYDSDRALFEKPETVACGPGADLQRSILF